MPRAGATRAVVVGAGFAGLAAAEALAAAGCDVTVLEATDRVGGRVRSHRLDDGSVVELGAEFVLPGYEHLARYASRLGLRLYEKGTLYGDREPRGGPPVTERELAAALEALGGLCVESTQTPGKLRSVADAGHDPGRACVESTQGPSGRESVAGVLLGLPAGPREVIASRIAVSTAYELDDQPASVLADGAAGFGTFASHGIAGGNDRVAYALAERLGGRVRLDSPVEEISWTDDGVRVRTHEDELVADAAVIATPAPRALAIAFDPALPDWKRRALEAVRYGHAAKLFMPLAGPAPPSATLSVPGRFWIWTQNAPEGGELPVAASFAGTPAALERLEIARGPERWAAAVRELRPDLAFADAKPLLSTWPDGAYSARSISSPLDEEALARPLGPLAFAGEHTAGAWHGLMEGALASGIRAAADLLD